MARLYARNVIQDLLLMILVYANNVSLIVLIAIMMGIRSIVWNVYKLVLRTFTSRVLIKHHVKAVIHHVQDASFKAHTLLIFQYQ